MSFLKAEWRTLALANYIIKDFQSDSLLKEFHDEGKFNFTYREVGNLSEIKNDKRRNPINHEFHI